MSQAANSSIPSTASPARTATGTLDAAAALEWFEAVIWHDHQVCSNCFSRLKHSQTSERDAWGNEETRTWRTDSSTLEYGHDPMPDPPQTTCLECGSMGGGKAYDTLSEQEMVDRVPELVDRVEEAGHQVNVGVVYGTVRRLATDEDWASDDKRIFATAAALGVDKA